MKPNIHPAYTAAKVTCACGNTFTTGSTVPEIRVEICSNCHPFYTGKQKLIDTAGTVDRFKQKFAKSQAAKATRATRAAAKKAKPAKATAKKK